MSLPDMIFIFVLVLIIFGPKKLPEISRQIGKMMFEFRRASNEFKMQMDEELRAAEQAERQKQVTAQSSAAALPHPAGTAPAPDPTPSILPPGTGAPVSANPPTYAATLAAQEAGPAAAESGQAERGEAGQGETERGEIERDRAEQPSRTEFRGPDNGSRASTAPDASELYESELRGEEPLHHG